MCIKDKKSTQELLERLQETSDKPAEAAALYDLVMDNLGYRLFRAIEAAKVRLSSQEETVLDFEEARIQLHEPITRAGFETASEPLLRELGEVTEGLLARCAGAGEVDAVFLTGGSSQIPAVRRLYTERFGEARVRTRDAFTSVAEGLGRASAAL